MKMTRDDAAALRHLKWSMDETYNNMENTIPLMRTLMFSASKTCEEIGDCDLSRKFGDEKLIVLLNTARHAMDDAMESLFAVKMAVNFAIETGEK